MKHIFERLKEWGRIAREDVKTGEKLDDLEFIQEKLSEMNLYPPSKIDGIYGPTTKRSIRDYIEIFQLSERGITTIDQEGSFDLRTKDDLGPVDLRPGNKRRYHMMNQRPQCIVIHWTAGPTTAESLYRLFSRTDRGVSSHFALDLSGIYQYLPATRAAWHAGWINSHAIGIDICQPVQTSRLQNAEMEGYKTEIIDNPSNRGDKQVLKLDDRIVEMTAKLVVDLCDINNIELKSPDNQNVIFNSSDQLDSWEGVLGHHHVSASKWDVAPWFEEIMEKAMEIKK